MKHSVSFAALACAIAATVPSRSALGQTVLPPPPPPPAVVVERSTLPNPALFRGGVAIFAVGYIPALGVAFFSDHKGDANLFIPVAGPWIDLGTRDCSGTTVMTYDGLVETGTGNRCGASSTEQAALIIDGIVQGLGALGVIGSFLVPEHKMAAWAGGPRSPASSFSPSHVMLGPSSFSGRGMGAVASGRF